MNVTINVDRLTKEGWDPYSEVPAHNVQTAVDYTWAQTHVAALARDRWPAGDYYVTVTNDDDGDAKLVECGYKHPDFFAGPEKEGEVP